jgi:hypothetical protein
VARQALRRELTIELGKKERETMKNMLRVFCMTWNMELEQPDEAQLTAFFRTSPPWTTPPDIVVIGIQEGGSAIHYRELFEKALPLYVCVAKTKFKGITKSSQIFAMNRAAQGLYVFVRGVTEDKKYLADLHGADTGKGTKSLLSEKGYCYAEVSWDGRRIAFVSTHAEVKEEKRGADFATIEKHLEAQAARYVSPDTGDGSPKAKPFDAAFMMGDLNYRLTRKADAKNDVALDAERAELWEMMSTPEGRRKLLARDTFDRPNDPLWQWKGFSTDCLPTYKRLKAKDARDLLRQMERGNGKYPVDVLKKLYPLKVSEKGGSCWDCGYLDRIGVASNQDRTTILAKDLLHMKSASELKAANFLVGGDHVPVYALYELEYD